MRQQASAGRESSRLLVVDDDDGVRRYVARVLSEAGYQVETAANGAEGLKVVHSGATFDLIVSDVRMPQMTGPQFIAELRRQETDIKVLYLTGYVDQLFKERETLWQDEAFLDKPCSPNGLLESVSLLLFGHLAPPAAS
jgi:two-component system cell cycle sensor histidine kinase/response regulator CckA